MRLKIQIEIYQSSTWQRIQSCQRGPRNLFPNGYNFWSGGLNPRIPGQAESLGGSGLVMCPPGISNVDDLFIIREMWLMWFPQLPFRFAAEGFFSLSLSLSHSQNRSSFADMRNALLRHLIEGAFNSARSRSRCAAAAAANPSLPFSFTSKRVSFLFLLQNPHFLIFLHSRRFLRFEPFRCFLPWTSISTSQPLPVYFSLEFMSCYHQIVLGFGSLDLRVFIVCCW